MSNDGELKLQKIVSGGQTGADRAALDVAMDIGLDMGGWVPHGRRSEDGRVPTRYSGLIETETDAYERRTALNVRDSDATLIFSFGKPTGGSALTLELARSSGKPHLIIDLEALPIEAAADEVRSWLARAGVRVLNVAGPRASGAPRITAAVTDVLRGALSPDRG